ncbi:NAD(P)-dependent oxidoreductase [Anaeromyxobacter diazotrophicus]|uniref:3-hydroxyisobutyrate dehydrogenase n=1 Tax=Anaeromyxobacter diazotrophicus TaxID=2590199 RepID=A0A7I9VPT0_9BACT|nr:NAD(P)-dependent oxidoreductase [Anaeromyxobacter diazotrophicus]GEJ58413.1 3-hydroxyisobutyrate dehydrogenase [Anaeromyxobacter diazotrophicus]
MRVGFIGLGSMGRGMAESLLRGGHEVVAWNRTRERAEALRGAGAAVAATPAEAARAGVVLTMLSDDRAVEAVEGGPDGLRAGLPRGGLHVSLSTLAPETVTRLAREHAAAGQDFLAAPVFGRPDVAAAGKLNVVAAGPKAALERARPLLDAVGQRVFPVGEDPAQAALVKLAGNFMLTAAIEALAEALALVGKAGVDRARFLEVLTETLFAAPAYRTYGRALLEGRFAPPGFTLPLGAKDNRLFLQAGERHQVPLPLASLVRDRMLAALARGYGGLDWAAFGHLAEEEAGAPPLPPAEPRG